MADIDELLGSTIAEVSGLIERREVSPVALVEAQLARIAALDGRIGSHLLVTADLAREQAGRAEREIAAGRYRGRLHGIPLGLSDLVATRGIPTTCGSPMLRDFRPDHDAAVVEKLAAAGAVCTGKLALAEFGFDGYHPAFTPPHNPWQPAHEAGMSAGGAAAATAASLCFGALGTDTGGSLRGPAAACGVVGLKPTFGRISRHGVFPLADTLDHVGLVTRSVADAAIVLAVLEGRDSRDPVSRHDPQVDYLAAVAAGAGGLRVGIDRAYCAADTDPAQADATARACFILKGQGLDIVDIDLAGITETCAHWLATCAVDALQRHREFFPRRAGEYGPAFRALLEHGLAVSAEAYALGQRARQATTGLLDAALRDVDCLLCPASPRPAQPSRDLPPHAAAPPALAALLRFSAPTNFSGHPSVTVPNGFTADGLPTAMQFIGRHGDEATVLRAAGAYERATGWHRRRPSLAP